jgi:hypothetical protein
VRQIPHYIFLDQARLMTLSDPSYTLNEMTNLPGYVRGVRLDTSAEAIVGLTNGVWQIVEGSAGSEFYRAVFPVSHPYTLNPAIHQAEQRLVTVKPAGVLSVGVDERPDYAVLGQKRCLPDTGHPYPAEEVDAIASWGIARKVMAECPGSHCIFWGSHHPCGFIPEESP